MHLRCATYLLMLLLLLHASDRGSFIRLRT